MYSSRYGDTIAFRMAAGESVHDALIALCRQHGVNGGFVVSGIGMLADPELGYFVGEGRYERRAIPGRFELLALQGNVSLRDGEPMAHLHAMLANEDLSVFGGHLFSAGVGLTLEGALSVVGEPVRMYRVLEAETGLPGLIVE